MRSAGWGGTEDQGPTVSRLLLLAVCLAAVLPACAGDAVREVEDSVIPTEEAMSDDSQPSAQGRQPEVVEAAEPAFETTPEAAELLREYGELLAAAAAVDSKILGAILATTATGDYDPACAPTWATLLLEQASNRPASVAVGHRGVLVGSVFVPVEVRPGLALHRGGACSGPLPEKKLSEETDESGATIAGSADPEKAADARSNVQRSEERAVEDSEARDETVTTEKGHREDAPKPAENEAQNDSKSEDRQASPEPEASADRAPAPAPTPAPAAEDQSFDAELATWSDQIWFPLSQVVEDWIALGGGQAAQDGLNFVANAIRTHRSYWLSVWVPEGREVAHRALIDGLEWWSIEVSWLATCARSNSAECDTVPGELKAYRQQEFAIVSNETRVEMPMS
jgi:hypothetical protein